MNIAIWPKRDWKEAIGLSDIEKQINEAVILSPWRNVYWFARMLMNTDQYGAIGKKDTYLLTCVAKLEVILNQKNLTEQEKYDICKDIILKTVRETFKINTKSFFAAENLALTMEDEINTIKDIFVFIITIQYIIIPTNEALKRVPSSDKEFSIETAKHILDSLGKKEISKVISSWDDLGVKGCLNVERTEIIRTFTLLKKNLELFEIPRSEIEDNAIYTAFIQEFERRLGQKRKSRAGNSLEDVATFIFDYYNFTSHPKPDHFQTDIEVDKWFKCEDGWSIGISCKRTLRERWKQVSSADSNALSRYKIKEIWHITTYDRDLSDDKLTMLGQQRQIFYLCDDSEKYKHTSSHKGMSDYVRPLSQLIDDIAKEQGKTM